MRVSLGSMPAPKRLMTADLSNLSGGLNLWDVPYRVAPNQSPRMKNLLWAEGALGSRRGQKYLNDKLSGKGYALYSELYRDKLIAHIGTGLYSFDPKTGESTQLGPIEVPEVRGTFFRYGDNLYYKTRGAYIKIDKDLKPTQVEGYTPVVLINASAATGAGDIYQPENRIQKAKTIWYNAATTQKTKAEKGTGSKKVFDVGYNKSTGLSSVDQVFVNTTLVAQSFYTVDLDAGTVTFTSETPLSSDTVTLAFRLGVKEYKIPLKDLESVDRVVVDGKELSSPGDYTVDLKEGKVTFTKAPPATKPFTPNTVKITYSKANPDAAKAIEDCRYAVNYGGDQNMCVVMGGSLKQPNAYFWNGNTSAGMDPSYFPIDSYNLAGATEDPVTGFGKQQSLLMVFTTTTVGKARYETERIGERVVISMPYTPINDRIGCDLPWTIQLIDNNLVFCNTELGAFFIANTSAANENNILGLSRNINGNDLRPGMLADIRNSDPDSVTSLDDGKRYWVVCNDKAYLWDFQLNNNVNSEENLSWFYFTNIKGIAFAVDEENIYHLSPDGKMIAFLPYSAPFLYQDFGEPIPQEYEFSVQDLGGYYYLKDVEQIIMSVRSDTNSTMGIAYETDWGVWEEKTPIRAWAWKLFPRNLKFRCLAVVPFAYVAVRKPGLRHIRHFSMRIYNTTESDIEVDDYAKNQNISILSAQIFYKTQGRDR